MYSEEQNKFLLIDFGLTHAVEGNVLEKSKLYMLGGTKSYMHKDLNNKEIK